VREDQLKKYIENRKSAVYNTLKTKIGELKVKNNFFVNLASVFRTLPKLRTSLFFLMKYNQTIPEFTTALMLLSYSAMTTLSCISGFISIDKRTVLYSDPIILDEIQTFLETVDKKKNELPPS